MGAPLVVYVCRSEILTPQPPATLGRSRLFGSFFLHYSCRDVPNLRARLPFLLHLGPRNYPRRRPLNHAMISITFLVEVGSVFTGNDVGIGRDVRTCDRTCDQLGMASIESRNQCGV